MNYTILGLDCSSTNIGCVVWNGTAVIRKWTIELPGKLHIANRCALARKKIEQTLWLWRPDVVAIESPVGKFMQSLIPQVRVSGAVMAACAEYNLLVHEITPSEAKLALAGKGNAKKPDMIAAAKPYGIDDEHQADALGIAIAASKVIKVEREAA